MQDTAYHAEDVAGLPHAAAYPVHIAAGQDALPPVGLAAYAGRELRGYAAKAQTREKPNINARGCASEYAAKAGIPHLGFLPLPCFAPGTSSRLTQGGTLPYPFPTLALALVLLLQHAPLHGGEVVGDSPEVGADHPVGHFGVDLGSGNVLVTEYLGKRLYRAAVAEIDGCGEGMPRKMESDRLRKEKQTEED